MIISIKAFRNFCADCDEYEKIQNKRDEKAKSKTADYQLMEDEI